MMTADSIDATRNAGPGKGGAGARAAVTAPLVPAAIAPPARRARPPRVAFMTTVGKNVGDDFIREGICSILDDAIGPYEPFYVNKHDLSTLGRPLLDEIGV